MTVFASTDVPKQQRTNLSCIYGSLECCSYDVNRHDILCMLACQQLDALPREGTPKCSFLCNGAECTFSEVTSGADALMQKLSSNALSGPSCVQLDRGLSRLKT